MSEAPEQRSTQWFQQRKRRVTGSMAGAALGLSPWCSRDEAMRRLVRDAIGAPSEETEFARAIMDHGTYAEAGSIFDFELETGLKVTPAPFVPIEDWSGCSVDGYVSDGGILEIKNPWSKRKDEVPVFKSLSEQPHYECQVYLGMYATGRKHAHFYQKAPNGSRHEIIDYDPAYIADILPRLRQFHAEMLHEIEHNAEEHLAPLRVTIDTPEAAKMVLEYDEILESLERLTERKADLLAEMVALSKERNALVGGRKLTLVKREGSVSYKRALDHYAPGADTSAFKGKPSQSWQLK